MVPVQVSLLGPTMCQVIEHLHSESPHKKQLENIVQATGEAESSAILCVSKRQKILQLKGLTPVMVRKKPHCP